MLLGRLDPSPQAGRSFRWARVSRSLQVSRVIGCKGYRIRLADRESPVIEREVTRFGRRDRCIQQHRLDCREPRGQDVPQRLVVVRISTLRRSERATPTLKIYSELAALGSNREGGVGGFRYSWSGHGRALVISRVPPRLFISLNLRQAACVSSTSPRGEEHPLFLVGRRPPQRSGSPMSPGEPRFAELGGRSEPCGPLLPAASGSAMGRFPSDSTRRSKLFRKAGRALLVVSRGSCVACSRKSANAAAKGHVAGVEPPPHDGDSSGEVSDCNRTNGSCLFCCMSALLRR